MQKHTKATDATTMLVTHVRDNMRIHTQSIQSHYYCSTYYSICVCRGCINNSFMRVVSFTWNKRYTIKLNNMLCYVINLLIRNVTN